MVKRTKKGRAGESKNTAKASGDEATVIVQIKPEITLSGLAPRPGSRRRPRRLGIGEGSGSGKTCGKGQKGQRSRCGFRLPRGFEGGQMPLHRRLPKIGFTSRKKVRGENVFEVVSLEQLGKVSEAEINLEVLRSHGLIKSRNARVKILGGAAVTRKFVVEAHAISASAKTAIEGAGGTFKLVR